MKNYWSCSKFADWLRGTPTLGAGSSEEWRAWEKKARAKKMRYWLAEVALDFVQNFIRWPIDRLNDVRYYIDKRWVTKTHQLTSHLKRGQWHDLDTRLLYCAFDELVNFVEVEQARHSMVCSREARKKYKTLRHYLGCRRCPEAGLAHLHWAAGLKHDEEWTDKDDPSFGQPTRQALDAQEILVLYNWWKERTNRPDPMDASGWSDYCDERQKTAEARGEDSSLSFLEERTDEERERSRKISDICHKMEQEQEDEDTEMLIRLVKVRRGLWT